MSHIRGTNTSIEVLVRSYLFRRGLRFRKNDKRYPGHPDVVLPKYHTIVFVNGCFWHMHEGCNKHSMPKSNVEFWTAKLMRNHERDLAQHAALEADGWRVIVVWECELTKAARDERLARLYDQIVGGTDGAGSTGSAGSVSSAGHEGFAELDKSAESASSDSFIGSAGSAER
ncbi:very short patch repair endonuclease [Bifidobacterium oedipodis]|uniref:Very short patch repair endonuclease n=1 Tax=Bifidobacterium oedipodis TaxID=2675322 RepID=A0A7Y0EPF0_9BIFI|nr:very short patch repair endonuclease [Bifidobacterium sp. DSM 109957]